MKNSKANFTKTIHYSLFTIHYQIGQSLIELIIAIALASLLLPALLTGLVASREGKAQEEQRLQATALLREAEDAVRSVREQNWSNISPIGTYHPQVSGSAWSLAAGSEIINGYTRQIEISNVNRDTSGNITESVGSQDTSTKKVVSTVSWNTPIASSVKSTTYLQRYLQNTSWDQTTVAHFNLGTHNQTATVPTGGGAVELAPGTGAGDWATPQVVATRNLPGNADAMDVYIDNNRAYIVTLSQGGSDFFIYDTTDPENPLPLGSVDLAADGYAVVVSGNFAYVATSHNSRELTVINVSNPNSPFLTGTHFNAPTNSDGRTVALSGTRAYLVTDTNTSGAGYEFYSINIASPLTPSQIGGINLGASARDIFVSGNFAYIASTANAQELQIVNVSNPLLPTLAGSYNATGNSDGQSIYLIGSTAYLTTNRLSILNVSNPSAVNFLGEFNAPGSPFGVYVVGNLAFLGHTQNNSEFKVVNVSIPASPTQIGFTSLGGNGLGVFVSGNYAYLATSSNSAEFQIVRGGSGATYQPSGDFASQIFDTGASVAFNNITWTQNVPVGTTLEFEVSTDGGATFFGPNGIGSRYTQPGAIPLNFINGQFVRYKAYFTGGVATPTLFDVSINYSP